MKMNEKTIRVALPRNPEQYSDQGIGQGCLSRSVRHRLLAREVWNPYWPAHQKSVVPFFEESDV